MIKLIQDEQRKHCSTDTQHIVNLSGCQWFRNILAPINDFIILDNACAASYGTYDLSQYCRKAVEVDISQEAISYAQHNFERDNVQFMEMDSTNLDFQDNYFDAIIPQDTVEHIHDEEKFISEIYRVLKPGGWAVLFTPHSKIHNDNPKHKYHVREYSKETFDALLRRYFSKITYYGRRQGPQLKRMEQIMNSIRRYETFYVRRIIPLRIRHFIGSCLTYFKTGLTLKSVSLENMQYSKGSAYDISLIAICQK